MATQPRQPFRRPVTTAREPHVERETDSTEQTATENFSAEYESLLDVATDAVAQGGIADPTGSGGPTSPSRPGSSGGEQSSTTGTPGSSSQVGMGGSGSSPLADHTDPETRDWLADRLGQSEGSGEDQGAPSTDLTPGGRRQNRESAYEQMTSELTPDIGGELGYGGAAMFAQDKNVVTGNAAAYAVVENKNGEAVKTALPFDQGVAVDVPGLTMGGLSDEYVPPPAEAPEHVTKTSEDGMTVVTKSRDGTVTVTSGHNNTETTINPDGSTETRNATTGEIIDKTKPLVTAKDADPEQVDTEGLEALRAFGRVLGIDETHDKGGAGTGDGHTDPADAPIGGAVGDGSAAPVDHVAMFGAPVGGDEEFAGRGGAVPSTLGGNTDVIDPSEQDPVTGIGAGREDDPLGEDRPDVGGPLDEPEGNSSDDPNADSGFLPISRFGDVEVDLAPASDIMDLDD